MQCKTEALHVGFTVLICINKRASETPDSPAVTRRRRGDGRALTPTERDVTELAAAGATNREIGHRLNIGVKTVEVHLTRAFRKLGVRRRSQLARVMGGGGPVSSADRPSR